jgi:hypothetical protein
MALQVTDDMDIVNSVVKQMFQFQGGKFALSMTEETVNTMGQALVGKFTRKAIKKNVKNKAKQMAGSLSAQAPAKSNVVAMAAVAAMAVVANDVPPWVVAAQEEERREQAQTAERAKATSLTSTSATLTMQQEHSKITQSLSWEPDDMEFEAAQQAFFAGEADFQDEDIWYPPPVFVPAETAVDSTPSKLDTVPLVPTTAATSPNPTATAGVMAAPSTPLNEYDSIRWLRTKLKSGQITNECYSEIADKFQIQKIRTMYQVKLLNHDLLVHLGIVALGHQMVLLSAIEQYKVEEQCMLQSRADFLFDLPDDDDI